MSQYINQVRQSASALSTSPLALRRDRRSQGRQGAPTKRVPRNRFEQAIQGIPGHERLLQTDDEVDARLRITNLSAEERAVRRKLYDEKVDKAMERSGGRVTTSGFKPSPDREESFYTIDIPDCDLKIRLWDGGLADDGLFLLDFVVKDDSSGLFKAVNSGGQFGIYPIHRPGILCSTGRLISWEEAWGIPLADIKPGCERFSLPEGAFYRLEREGMPRFDFVFRVPARERPHLLRTEIPIGRPSMLVNP
ncbi:hypothetical protein DENSPDRAFT_558990 [Dentipellis sp. KUC8613]|nr:hypothetical protein DENSPDRAFT_558990 [Dentipellis sp. KUC8613]